MERKPPAADKNVTPEGGHKKGREFARGDSSTDPILRNLKLAFAEVEAEPLPDELSDLISQLKAFDKEGGDFGRG
jgi:hypothetical protein